MPTRREFFHNALSSSLLVGGGAALGFWGKGQLHDSTISTDQMQSLAKHSAFTHEKLEKDVLNQRQTRLQNPLGPSPKAQSFFQNLERYWQDYAFQWRTRDDLRLDISRLHGIPFENVIVRPGSTIILYDLVRSFGRENGYVLLTDPDYYLVKEFMKWEGISYQTVSPNSDAKVNLEVLKEKSSKASLIYLSNPHLPYGQFHRREEMQEFISSCSPTPVIVDEAYIHYLGKGHEDESCIELTKKYPNLIVTRTFSKIYGLAGLRLGYFASSENIFDKTGWFDREVSPHSCLAGIGALQDKEFVKRSRHQTIKSQDYISKSLKKMGLEHLTGYGNFVTCRIKGLSKQTIKDFEKEKIYFQATKDGYFYHLIPTLFPNDVDKHLNKLKRIT